MKRALPVIVLLVVVLSGPSAAIVSREFAGGSREVTAAFSGLEEVAGANLSIKADSHVLHAFMKLSGLPAPNDTGAYPGSVAVRLGNSTLWEFNGTGAGGLGRQGVFSDGSNTQRLHLNADGATAGTSFDLMRGAAVKKASLEAECLGENLTLELAEWRGGRAGDYFGKAVSCAGDLNGDGCDDMVVGVEGDDTVSVDAGAALIYFGGPQLGTSPGLTLLGDGFNDIFGSTVSGAGDVNRDGYDDVIVGAPWNKSGAYLGGAAYIFYGGSPMDSRPDVVIRGTAVVGYLGMSVSGAGDVNRDGYDDVMVGEPGSDVNGQDSGAAHIYFGGPNMNNVSDINLSGQAAGDSFGWSVSGAGNVNGDGYDDVIVGAYYNDAAGTDAGAAYLFYGGAPMDSQADLVVRGAAAGDAFGYSVSGAGDVNGDGYDDVVAGAMRNSAVGNQSGRAYVYFGGPSMNGDADVLLTGATAGDLFGASVSDAGDVNGDRCGDVLVSAPWSSAPGGSFGQAYVFYGGAAMDGLPDITFNGSEYWDKYGFALSGAGDTNGDGYDEVIIGSAWEDVSGVDAGRAFVYTTAPFMLGPRVDVGSQTIWNASGYIAGKRQSRDFAGYLNGYLTLNPSNGSYGQGNSYVTLPVKVSAQGPGDIILAKLNITYDYLPSTTDFAEVVNGYLADHRQEKDQKGNVSVPIHVAARGPGRVRLSDLNLTVDEGPKLAHTIPTVYMDEDTARSGLLDLNAYFEDEYDSGPAVNFSVVYPTNGEFVALGIADGRFMSADALTGTANDNWTGTVKAVLRCTDRWGISVDSNQFDIVVRAVNDPPAFTSVPVNEAMGGAPYEYRLTASDGDNDPMSFLLEKKPDNMTLDTRTGWIRWTPPRSPGSYNVSASVTDGNSRTYQNFTIWVIVLNKAPKFAGEPGTIATAGLEYVYGAKAMDPDGDRLNFSLLIWPGTMSIEPTTGWISWTPGVDEAGNFTVVVKVVDGKGGEARQEYQLQVRPPVKPRVLIIRPPPGGSVTGDFTFSGRVEGSDLPVLGVRVKVDSGEWMNATGNSSWGLRFDTTALGGGIHTLRVRAYDATGFSDTATITFRVARGGKANPDPVPIIAVIALIALVAAMLLLWKWRRRPKPLRLGLVHAKTDHREHDG